MVEESIDNDGDGEVESPDIGHDGSELVEDGGRQEGSSNADGLSERTRGLLDLVVAVVCVASGRVDFD